MNRNLKKSYRGLLLALAFVTTSFTYAQQENRITVKGTVTNSETGKPIQWVTVAESNNRTNGMHTDELGQYTLTVPKNTKVAFTKHYYYGKSYTVNTSEFNVALKPVPKEVQEEWDRKAREGEL